MYIRRRTPPQAAVARFSSLPLFIYLFLVFYLLFFPLPPARVFLLFGLTTQLGRQSLSFERRIVNRQELNLPSYHIVRNTQSVPASRSILEQLGSRVGLARELSFLPSFSACLGGHRPLRRATSRSEGQIARQKAQPRHYEHNGHCGIRLRLPASHGRPIRPGQRPRLGQCWWRGERRRGGVRG